MKRKAIVLGGSGFIGSHLVDCLLDNDWKVLNFDVKEYFPKNKKYYEFVHADLTNTFAWSACSNCFKDINVIFHLAGISGIQDCLDSPAEAMNVNVMSTFNLLENIKNKKDLLLVFSSSMYVNSDLSGIYGITKRTCEDLIKFYHKQYGLNYLLFRVGTVYGTRANKHNSINNLIQKALKTGIISYYGCGSEIREYVHVKDVAQALVKLSSENVLNTTYEITGAYPLKAKDMIMMLKELLGDNYQVEFRNEKVINHYEITPYRYMPEVVKKYVPVVYTSLGNGLLELIKELDNESK